MNGYHRRETSKKKAKSKPTCKNGVWGRQLVSGFIVRASRPSWHGERHIGGTARVGTEAPKPHALSKSKAAAF